jgi:hypothetical protein
MEVSFESHSQNIPPPVRIPGQHTSTDPDRKQDGEL